MSRCLFYILLYIIPILMFSFFFQVIFSFHSIFFFIIQHLIIVSLGPMTFYSFEFKPSCMTLILEVIEIESPD